MNEKEIAEMLAAARVNPSQDAGGGLAVAADLISRDDVTPTPAWGDEVLLRTILQPNENDLSFECIMIDEALVEPSGTELHVSFSCDITAWDLTRVEARVAPLLFNHDMRGETFGYVDKVWESQLEKALPDDVKKRLRESGRDLSGRCLCARGVCHANWMGRHVFEQIAQGQFRAVSPGVVTISDLADMAREGLVERITGKKGAIRINKGIQLRELTVCPVGAGSLAQIANTITSDEYRAKLAQERLMAHNMAARGATMLRLAEDSGMSGEDFFESDACRVLVPQNLSEGELAMQRQIFLGCAARYLAPATADGGEKGGEQKPGDNSLKGLDAAKLVELTLAARRDGAAEKAKELEAELTARKTSFDAELQKVLDKSSDLQAQLEARDAEDKRRNEVSEVLRGTDALELKAKDAEAFGALEKEALEPATGDGLAMSADTASRKVLQALVAFGRKEAEKTPEQKALEMKARGEKVPASEVNPPKWTARPEGAFESPLTLCAADEKGAGRLGKYVKALLTGEGASEVEDILNAREHAISRSLQMMGNVQGVKHMPQVGRRADSVLDLHWEFMQAKVTKKMAAEFDQARDDFMRMGLFGGSTMNVGLAAAVTKSDIDDGSPREVTNVVGYLWSRSRSGQAGFTIHMAFGELFIPVEATVPTTRQNVNDETEDGEGNVVQFSDYTVNRIEIKPVLFETAVQIRDKARFFLSNLDSRVAMAMTASHYLGKDREIWGGNTVGGMIGLINQTGIGGTVIQDHPRDGSGDILTTGQLPALTNPLEGDTFAGALSALSADNALKSVVHLLPERVKNRLARIMDVVENTSSGNVVQTSQRKLFEGDMDFMGHLGLATTNYAMREITHRGVKKGASQEGKNALAPADVAAGSADQKTTVGDVLVIGERQGVHVADWQNVMMEMDQRPNALKDIYVITSFCGLGVPQKEILHLVQGVPPGKY